MKKIILPLLVLTFSPSVFASQNCTDQNNGFICDSTTVVGNTSIFFNPRLHTSSGDAHVITTTSGGAASRQGEIGLCKALGMSALITADYGDANLISNAYVVILNDTDGSITDFSLFPAEAVATAGYKPISVLTCKK